MFEQKEIISKNLVNYRIANNLTQLELAEKLNYSDKAISKWERGEAFPDILVFVEIAKLYRITVDDLLSPTPKKTNWIRTNEKVLIPLISFSAIWLLAILTYFLFENIVPEFESRWLVLIYAIPISFLVIMIFNFIWGKKILSILLTSAFFWTILISIYLTLDISEIIFLIGIPGEIIIGLGFSVNTNKSKGVRKLK